jgi:hypothetical protein
MPPPIMTATYMASTTEPPSRYFHLLDIGIKLDDFEPDLLRANPHKRKLANRPASARCVVGPYLRGGATRA